MANVLLVDDDGSVLLTLAIALRRYGHSVTVACDANQALLYLRRHHYSYLVSDVRMPGLSGIDLALKARRLADPPRIILTSAYSNIPIREGIVDAFLQKPIDTERLNAILSQETPDTANSPAHAATNGLTTNGAAPTGAPAERNSETRREARVARSRRHLGTSFDLQPAAS